VPVYAYTRGRKRKRTRKRKGKRKRKRERKRERERKRKRGRRERRVYVYIRRTVSQSATRHRGSLRQVGLLRETHDVFGLPGSASFCAFRLCDEHWH
jgi:hypothetical protein